VDGVVAEVHGLHLAQSEGLGALWAKHFAAWRHQGQLDFIHEVLGP